MRFIGFVFLLLSSELYAQLSSGARFSAMAGAGVAMEDVFSLGSNQAGVASADYVKLALSFEEHFHSSGTRSMAAMAVVPSRIGVVGWYASRYSFGTDYSEVVSGLTYARMVGSKLAASVTANYHLLSIPKYYSAESSSFDLGFQYRLTQDWLWAWHLVNPLGFVLSNETAHEIPAKVKIGTSYLFSRQAFLVMEAEYDNRHYTDFRIGLEYSVLDWLKLRGGNSVNPFQQFAGVGFGFKKIGVDYSAAFHPQLGVSSQFSFSYGF